MVLTLRKDCWSLAFALLVGSASMAAAQRASASNPKIFRQVTFQPFAPITLGRPLPGRAPRTIPVRPGRVALTLHDFGDSDSVYVDSNSDFTVRALEFVYPRTKDIRAAVADYEQFLWPAHQAATDSARQRLQRWTWRDSDTEFQLSVLGSSHAVGRVWSVLRDRQHP
jgi:hypothetical protein